MSDDPYVYPGTAVLRNKFDLRDAARLDYEERFFSTQRAEEGVPKGDFDLKHLQAIHRHLFQDVYDWAGQLRTLEISKGGHQFMFRQYIASGMADVHKRIRAAKYFKGQADQVFAVEAGKIIGDVNYVHPFREGNGRTQLLYLQQLCEKAGHSLDLRAFDRDAWMDASRAANNTDYAPMGRVIGAALGRAREQGRAR